MAKDWGQSLCHTQHSPPPGVISSLPSTLLTPSQLHTVPHSELPGTLSSIALPKVVFDSPLKNQPYLNLTTLPTFPDFEPLRPPNVSSQFLILPFGNFASS